MSRIETYFLLAVGCLLDLSGAEFYNSSGFSAYTWPGLVISKAVSLAFLITTHVSLHDLLSTITTSL